jgi:hypothetical protein
MRRVIASSSVVGVMVWIVAAPVLAQTTDQQRGVLAAPAGPGAQSALRLKEARYQIGQMERLLEGAVEHGATVIRDRLQALMPADMLLADNARARGFRLDGYGLFFDVEVPSLEGTVPWIFRTLDQNALGLDSALRTVRSFIDNSAAGDVNLQQALKRIELQVAPVNAPLAVAAANSTGARNATGSAAATAADTTQADDPILNNPDETYRTQIREALMDTMLEHSRGLEIGASEWLTVAARRRDDRPRLAPADTDARTVVISVRGSDLTAFLAGQISREEARKRVDVRVF